jgi:16S rRNA processing protein RimM
MPSSPENLVLVGYTQKPYGLFGELKIRPATFDFDRHTDLSTVWFRKRDGQEAQALEVRATRADGEFWYLKFKGMLTPEAVGPFSGGQLLIPAEERRELPEEAKTVGSVLEVLEQGATEMLVVATGRKDILIPWNDHFVKRIDKAARVVHVDLSALRNIL